MFLFGQRCNDDQRKMTRSHRDTDKSLADRDGRPFTKCDGRSAAPRRCGIDNPKFSQSPLSAQFAGIDAALACLRQRKQALDSELKHLTDALVQGRQSQSIMAAVGERETELRSITDRLLEPRPRTLRVKLDELRTFAVSRLTKIRELLAHPEDVEKAHEAIAERVGQLTLEATNENGKRTYLAHGKVDFFGEEGLAHSGGAACPDHTTRAYRFSLPLA